MTVQEMNAEFLVLYDKITNFDAPGYEAVEISTLLTKAQERVFLSYYNLLGNRFKEGFDQTEERKKELQQLVVGTTLVTASVDQTNTLPNGTFYDLPTDCLFVITEEITSVSTDECKDAIRGEVVPITHDQYSRNIKNPFKKPNVFHKTWRLDYNTRRHEIITDGSYTIGSYHLRYIKILKPILTDATVTLEGSTGPLDSELNAILHRRIIDEAVKIATGITDPQQYQIKSIEQQEAE